MKILQTIKDFFNGNATLLKVCRTIANKYFFYEKSDIKLLSSGSMGTAFIVDSGKKILKITRDKDEALRAERIRGKNNKNLIFYYDVRKIKSSNRLVNGGYCLLMDRLPKLLTDDKIANDIFNLYDKDFGISRYCYNLPGYDIKDRDKLKKFIKDRISGMISEYDGLSDEYKIVAERMWFDIIQIRNQLRKYGIKTNDLVNGNLGFNNSGDLVFFDLGYPGYGGKNLKKKSEIVVERFSDFTKNIENLK